MNKADICPMVLHAKRLVERAIDGQWPLRKLRASVGEAVSSACITCVHARSGANGAYCGLPNQLAAAPVTVDMSKLTDAKSFWEVFFARNSEEFLEHWARRAQKNRPSITTLDVDEAQGQPCTPPQESPALKHYHACTAHQIQRLNEAQKHLSTSIEELGPAQHGQGASE